jgi:alpha-L-fucosidase
LNIPPNREGLFESNDVAALKEFKSILDETFAKNLALNAKVKVSNTRANAANFAAKNITDPNDQSFWAVDDGQNNASFEVTLSSAKTFDRILLQEPIRYGQRISKFEVQAWIDQQWKTISTGTTIGYKRLLRFDPIQTDKVKVIITEFNNAPAISNFAIYQSSTREK